MKRCALITGAHGFIGRYIARGFSEADHRVIGIGHGDWPAHESAHWGLDEWHNSDITMDELLQCHETPDVLVHCAGSGSVGFSMQHPMTDFERTVWTTHYVLEYIRTRSPNTILLYLSSAAVYGVCSDLPIAESTPVRPVSPYGYHKQISEDICRMYSDIYGLKVAIVRMFSVYGEGLKKQLLWDTCEKIRLGSTHFWGTGEETRDWIHVEDAAKAVLAISDSMTSRFEVFNLASGVGTQIRDVVETVFKFYKTNKTPSFNGLENKGNPAHYAADISKLTAIGWSPSISLDDGIAGYVEWYKKEVPDR